MQKYKSNITTTSGAAVRNVPVTVLKEDGSLASLFLDRDGHVAEPNPLKTGADGTFSFYAANGRYSLRTTVDGVTISDDDVVLLADPVELAQVGPIAEAIAAGGGASADAALVQRAVTVAATTDMQLVQIEGSGLLLVSVQSTGGAAADYHDIELYDGPPSAAGLRYHARQVAGDFEDAIPVYCRLDSKTLHMRVVNKRADAQPVNVTIGLRHMFGG